MPVLPNNNQNLAPNSQAQKPVAGTGFTNLKQVINANRQNRLGSAVTQGTQQVVGGAKQQLGQAQNEFNTGLQQSQQQLTKDQSSAQNALAQIGRNNDEIKAGNSTNNPSTTVNTQQVGQAIPYDPNQPRPTDQGQQSGSNITAGVPQYDQQSGNASVNPPAQYQTQEQVDAFGRLAQGQYQGPRGLNQSDQLQRQASDAESIGQMAGDTEGRRGLLQRFAGQGQYTAGQQRLDNLLLGQTANGALNQARRDSRGLSRNVNQAVDQASLLGNQQDLLTRLASQKVKGDVGSSVNTNEDYLNNATQQAQAQNSNKFNAIKSLLQTGQPLNDEDAKYLEGVYSKGRDAQDSNFLGSKNFLDYLKDYDNTAVNRQNVSSVDDVRRAQALQAYSGAVGRDYNAGLDESKAGTFNNMTGIDVRQNDLDALKKSQQDAYNATYNPGVQQGTTLTNELNDRNQYLNYQSSLLNLLNKSKYDPMAIGRAQNTNAGNAEQIKYDAVKAGLSPEDAAQFDTVRNQLAGQVTKERDAGRFHGFTTNPGQYSIDNLLGKEYASNDLNNVNQKRQAQLDALNQLRTQYSAGGLRGANYGLATPESQIGAVNGAVNNSKDTDASWLNYFNKNYYNQMFDPTVNGGGTPTIGGGGY